ncbi:NAD(P)-dependent oxidoreductase [Amycolatopsis thermophila]|uniref:Phosphoglycerate dehydrogenase-like enzyme n=1 Tax=Amycolatopsis thermophila TaxID=206084 RepID=A0ABU0F1N6_9PSEU|nr:NAD(P)-dependent oxidoreductase [Amycolatopsis thermophila]MDQ0381497.1 phosphoglycerate dehydrogenase-like enzyme [Amycolatopsis thermophila]
MSYARPRMLILDDWEGEIRTSPGADRLRELADVTVLDGPLAEVPDDELADVRVVLAIRERTRFNTATLNRLPRLELILQTGGHAYHIDADEVGRRGIVVPLWRSHDACEAAMRELTFGLMIAALRKFPEANQALSVGDWPGILGGTLRGRRLGILGMGLQGKAVARLGRAFDMDVVAWARPGSSAVGSDDGVPRLPMDELLTTSDVVSIHLRLSPDSRGLLGAAELRSMKPGSVLINTARGAIVDEEALVEVLRDGPLRAAGLDVFTVEPLPKDSPLRSLPNVVLTPHIGWTVREAFAEFADGAAGQLEDYLAHRLDQRELAFPPPQQRGTDVIGGVSTR